MFRCAKTWILLSSWLVATGWVLSAFHALNPAGYFVSLAIGGLLGGFWVYKNGGFKFATRSWRFSRLRRRFRRPAPLLFLLLAGMTLVAGVLYRDDNGDSDSYRIPRVLHWLAQGQWHWIRTMHPLMNISNCNFEWLSAPLLLFTHTDRTLFLINWISLLLLPGLTFSFLKSLGVRPRVAWWWMWLLASGWCFAFQASSTVNDGFAGVYVLAGVVLTLQARRAGSPGPALLGLIALAFATGVKLTNLPLLLLWVVIIAPSWRLLLRRPLLTLLAAGLSVAVSFLPIAVANLHHVDNWAGVTKNSPIHATELHTPFWGIIGNTFSLTVQNLMPPVFPQADQWNELMERFVRTPFGSHFRSFSHFGTLGHDTHSVNETNAGIGAGICLLTGLTLLAAWRLRRSPGGSAGETRPPGRFLRLVPWFLLLIFMAKVGTVQSARHLSPYYILLFPLLLCQPGISRVVRQRWWQLTSLGLMLVTLIMVAMIRERPLFPAQTLSQYLIRTFPNSTLPPRIANTFSGGLERDKFLTFLAAKLPAGEPTIGYAVFMEAQEPCLWRPWGQRTVVRVMPADKPADWQAAGVHYIVMESFYLNAIKQNLADWLKQNHGVLTADYIRNAAQKVPPHVYLIRLADNAG